MALILDEKETPTIPPPNKRELFVDTDGQVKQLKSDGTKSAISGGGWYGPQEDFLKAAVPALTTFERLKIGNAQSGNITLPAGWTDGGTVGGSLKTNSSAPVPLQTGSAFQTLKTVPWGLSMRVKYAAIAAGDSSLAGFGNGASFTMFGSNQATDGTKFVFFTADGVGQTTVAASLNADTNWHTVALTFDLTTITAWVDGLPVLTTTTTTRLPTVAQFVAAYGINGGSGGGLTFISRAVYGFIDP